MKNQKTLPKESSFSPLRLLIVIIGVIFFSEFIIVLLLPLLLHGLSALQQTTLDAFLFTLLVIPVLYLFAYRPRTNFIKNIMDMSEKMRKSCEISRLRLENVTDIITILDENGTIQYQTPAAERILGYTQEEFIGKSALNFIHPEDIPLLLDFFNTHLKISGVTTTIKYRMKHRDGTWCYMESIANNLLNHPDVKSIIVNSRDISDRKMLEDRLKENEQCYKSLFDYNSDAVYSIDFGSNFTSVNPICTILTGYSSEELLSKSFIPLIAPGDLGRTLKYFDLACKGNPQNFEITIIHKQGQFIDISVTIVPIIVNDNIAGVHGIAKDITEKKLATTALKESEERYSSIFNNNHAIMLLVDPGTAEIKDANPDATRFYGYNKEKLLQMKITDINIYTTEEVFAEMEGAKKSKGGHFQFRHCLANDEARYRQLVEN